ncbi:MAG: cupin domain-containing protein [Gemmatimonadales bacterium]|nr:cupin domain-containing protein [Gemmatimonadales bacterium]
MNGHIRRTEDFRWKDIPVSAYKPGGTHFAGITRQLLFDGGEGLRCQLRYFEVAPGGYSSLERHRHEHAIMVIRGQGRALVGERILELATHDLVRVPPLTWHQFRPGGEQPFGFLCMVDCGRDRPERPDAKVVAELRRDPGIAEFIRL